MIRAPAARFQACLATACGSAAQEMMGVRRRRTRRALPYGGWCIADHGVPVELLPLVQQERHTDACSHASVSDAAPQLAKVYFERTPTVSSKRREKPPSHVCYSPDMTREVTQRQLRNDSGEIMRALDAGESFVVTRNGVAVGELRPVQRHRFVRRDAVLEAFARAAALDIQRFRKDLDRRVEQHPAPRA
jgi:antitoxin (DNA-binding transcriptional repressor) of toxin-antitoxin stability system